MAGPVLARSEAEAVRSLSWPSARTKLTIDYMAQDVSLAGLPDDYTEFSSASESVDAGAWAYDACDGDDADNTIEIVDDAYFDGAFDDAANEPPQVDPFVAFGSILERAARTLGGDSVDSSALCGLLGLE